MKKFLIPLLALSISATAPMLAQENQLRVAGTSQLALDPDQVNLSFSLEARAEEMGEAMESMRQQTAQYVAVLKEQGFKEEEIGTVSLQVNRQSNYRNGERIDIGYQARQRVVVQFPFQKKRLSEILKAVAAAELNAQFDLRFSLSDEKQQRAQEQLLVMAVQDAQRKATLISQASEIKLGPVQHIDYGTSSSPQPMRMMDGLKVQAMNVQSDNYQVNPEALMLRDQITVTYRLGIN